MNVFLTTFFGLTVAIAVIGAFINLVMPFKPAKPAKPFAERVVPIIVSTVLGALFLWPYLLLLQAGLAHLGVPVWVAYVTVAFSLLGAITNTIKGANPSGGYSSGLNLLSVYICYIGLQQLTTP
jgi:hypothetical protein